MWGLRPGCLVLVLFALLVAGCNRGPAYRLVPVSGKLTYKGQGVKRATVQLLADAATPVPTATGQTDDSGAFTLQTPPHGAGAVPGRYKVTIQQYHSLIPARYGNPAETPETIVVPDAGLSNWEIKLRD